MTDQLINKKDMPRTKEQFEEIRSKTKHKILESALILFAEKGFKGTSINDIAKLAGISKGLAYNYFKNKNELLVAVFGLLTEKMGELYVLTEKETDPRKKLKIVINQTFLMLQKDEKFWRLYMNFALLPEIKETADNFMSEFISVVFTEIENIFKEIGIKNPSAESKVFGAIIDGVCFHYIFDKDNYPIEKMRKYIINKYCND